MHDNSQQNFIGLLKRRGLVEKAAAIRDSWPNGYIAQNHYGEVYLYNGEVKPDISGWQRPTPTSKVIFHQIGMLKHIGDWKDLIIPTRALWQPLSSLEPVQQRFLNRLHENGIAAKVQSFLDSWKQESWIVMDANGTVDLYNLPPIKGSRFWSAASSEVSSWYRLDTIKDPQFDWAECAVTLTDSLQPVAVSSRINFDLIDRVDCWL